MALNNVPLTGQSLSVTKVPINSNFSTIDNAFAVDHVRMTPPGTVAPQGFHNKVTLPAQAASPVIGANNGLYALSSAVTGITETFWHSQSASGAFDFPVTASIFSTTAVPKTVNDLGNQGWCYLPSGFIMKWGTLLGSQGQPFAFPVAANIPPFTTAVQYFDLTMFNPIVGTTDTIRINSINKLNFSWTITNQDNNSRFTYLAIGY